MEQNQEARKTQQMLIVLLTVGAVPAIASLLLRILTGGEYEVKTVDLIFLVIPLLVVALVTGKLTSLDMFGVKADFPNLWAAAGRTEIRDQVSTSLLDAVEYLPMARKGTLQELRELIGSQRKVEALEFKLGDGNYSGEAVEKYFKALADSLRVVVVTNPEGKLFAIYNAPDLISSLRFSEGSGYAELAEMLNSRSKWTGQSCPSYLDSLAMTTW